MNTVEDPKPKSKINGERNPEYFRWWNRNNREKTRLAAKAYAKRKSKVKREKKTIAKAITNNCRKSILAMINRGRSHTTIAVVLRIPISCIIKVLNEQNTKP